MLGTALRRVGIVLLVLAAMMIAVGILMVFDPDPKEGSSPLIGALLLGAFFAIPGVTCYWYGRKRGREAEFVDTLVGYIRSFDRFSSAEMAKRTGLSEFDVEKWIARISNRSDINLLFHRPDRTWVHRERISSNDTVVESCRDCGADVGPQLIMASETVRCPYCNNPLR